MAQPSPALPQQPPPRVSQCAGGQQHRDAARGQQPAHDDDLPAVPPELLADLLDALGVLAAGHPADRRRPAEPADREGDQVPFGYQDVGTKKKRGLELKNSIPIRDTPQDK